MVERVLPEEIQEKLSSSEEEYFNNHVATLQSYMSDVDLQLNVVIIFLTNMKLLSCVIQIQV